LFTVFAVKADKLDVTAETISCGRRLQFAFQYAGEGGDHGVISPLNEAVVFQTWRCFCREPP
jgi:hypothetical protein